MMKKILALTIVVLISTVIQIVAILPWWSFLIPIFFLGILLPMEKWKVSSFPTGFFSGFLVWVVATFYYEATYDGEIIDKIAKIIMDPYSFFYLNFIIIYSIIGLIGGLLTGLALYSGFLLRKGRDILYLELPYNKFNVK
ncbi:MAG: hypothetical protein Q8L81_02820 [Bacteroidota bacterium]|nr:hypothetical protein [Bacteroidota bacterium]